MKALTSMYACEGLVYLEYFILIVVKQKDGYTLPDRLLYAYTN